jgi:hypothetical protein
MDKTMTAVEKNVRLSVDQADRLQHLAQSHQLSEDRIIARALEILFNLTDLLDAKTERQGWSFLSEDSLKKIWENEQDAEYDHWRQWYGVPTR